MSRSPSCLALIILGAHAVGAAPPKDSDVTPVPTVAERIVARTNATRREHKLAELAPSSPLTAAAQALGDHMAKTGQLSHMADGRTPAQRVEAQEYQWMFVAENIAYRSAAGSSADQTAELLLQQWLNSPGHRANILSGEPTQIGAATATAKDGSVYAVQVFAKPHS